MPQLRRPEILVASLEPLEPRELLAGSTIRLTGPSPVAGDFFGEGVGISGDWAICGAFERAGDGRAYFFHRDASGWQRTQEVAPVPGSGAGTMMFGGKVSISGDWALVGSAGSNTSAGDAYLYHREGTTWKRTQILTASDAKINGNFGLAVSISGDYLAVGAPNYFGNGADKVYVFGRSGSVWAQKTILSVPGATSFGMDVAVSGTQVLVGAPFTVVSGKQAAGQAYIFAKTGSGWARTATLWAPKLDVDGHFGMSVAMVGSTAMVGTDDTDGDGDLVHVYSGPGGVWSHAQTLGLSSGSGFENTIRSIAFGGNVAVVGAGYRSTYLFQNMPSSGWTQKDHVTFSAMPGASAAVGGDSAIVGDPNYADGSGAAFIMAKPDLTLKNVTAASHVLSPGLIFNLTCALWNNGRAPVAANDNGGYRIQLRLSKDKVWGNSDDIVLGTGTEFNELAASSGRVRELAGSVSSGTPKGSYYLMARIDSEGAVGEFNKSNNTWFSPAADYKVVAAAPDLTATSFTGPSAVKWGGTITLKATLKNLGTSDAGKFAAKAYVLSAINFTPLYLQTRTVTALKHGASVQVTFTITLPKTPPTGFTKTGKVNFSLYIDSPSVIAETDETNNTRMLTNIGVS